MKRYPSISAMMQDEHEPSRIMQRLVNEVLRLVPCADGSAIALLDDEAGGLVYANCAGSLSNLMGSMVGVQDSLVGYAVLTGRMQFSNDIQSDRRANPTLVRAYVRSLISIPIRYKEGRCLGGFQVTSSLENAFSEQDLEAVERLASFIGSSIGGSVEMHEIVSELLDMEAESSHFPEFVVNILHPGFGDNIARRRRIEDIINNESLSLVFQPIVNLATGKIVAVEALSRFPEPPYQSAGTWFSEARSVNLGVSLELLAVRSALRYLPRIPDGCLLDINVGAEAIVTSDFRRIISHGDPSRIVLELTEDTEISDYQRLLNCFEQLKDTGFRIALDDTGAGFASFSHLVRLSPDVIKLDRDMIRGLDHDPVRHSLCAAVATFADDTGAMVIAEGIEQGAEAAALKELGIDFGQGFYLGRPGPFSSLSFSS